MATPSLTNVPSVISTAESTTGWTGDTFSLEPDIKIAGGNSVACAMTPNAGNTQEIYYTGFTAADLSAVHLRLWFNITFIGNLGVTNPVQAFISDGTDSAYWDIDVTEYAGGWKQVVVYTGNTVLSGTRPAGNSTRVGLSFTVATKPRNVPANAWFDAWYYGDGYTATGGTVGDEINLTEISIVDAVTGYGVAIKDTKTNVIALSGEIQIGSASAASTVYSEENSTLAFINADTSVDLYALNFTGSVTTASLSGNSVNSAGVQYRFNGSSTEVTSLDLDANTFFNISTASFSPSQTITDNKFDSCGTIFPSTALFTGNTISNSSATRSLNAVASNNIDNCNFTDNYRAVWYETAGTYDDTNNFYLDNIHDVENSSAGLVTINASESNVSSSINTGGGTTSIINSVVLNVTTKDTNNINIESASVAIYVSGSDVELMNEYTIASGLATAPYNYLGDTNIYVRVRKSTTALGTRYYPVKTTGLIEDKGFNLTVVMNSDDIVL